MGTNIDDDPHGQQKPKGARTNLDLDLNASIELVVLSVKELAARCRILGRHEVVTFRADRPWDLVPGEIAVIKPRKQWSYAGRPCLSGEIESTRVDAEALGLTPLALKELGMWDPKEHYWGDEGEPMEGWARRIVAWGPRPYFEMEQVLPGEDFDDPDGDPIIEANDLMEAGDYDGARKTLMDLCFADLGCLDAHAHLGLLIFDSRPADALRHYEIGVRIGELSLGDNFDGLLPWGHIDNRPSFVACRVMDCACGGVDDSMRLSWYSIGCFG